MECLGETDYDYNFFAGLTGDVGTNLEALGGGFNVTLEALQSPARRGPIARKLRDFAEVTEEIRRALQRGIDSCF